MLRYNRGQHSFKANMLMRLRWVVFQAIILAVVSFSALYYIITTIWPDTSTLLSLPLILVFLLLFVGLSSVTVPVTAYLNYRFAKAGWRDRDRSRLLRQGIWVGLLGVVLAYLQLIRALNLMIGFFVLAAFVLIELFFLTREEPQPAPASEQPPVATDTTQPTTDTGQLITDNGQRSNDN